GRDGTIELGGLTSAELVAKHVAGARVIKAFNTIFWQHLRDESRPNAALDDRRVIPLSGDDANAKQVVAALSESMGFAPLDLGSLHDGGLRSQPGTPIYNKDITLAEAKKLVPS